MNILLLSTGGGGGNILRSVKALFERDVAVTERTDPAYAERLRGAITTRFLDTNEFSLSDLPPEERLLIGTRTTGRLGARHNPDVARQALEESHSDVQALLERHAAVILIGSGGKGTGAGTIFPLAQMARDQRKLVLPIFVRPSFERHEVDKRRYDHALAVVEQFDRARIRFIEILNDRGYDDADPLPQSTVWERMNVPIARALRGLMYVLWDLSQVDPSDLSMLFAGHGRLRIGFGGIDTPDGAEPGNHDIDRAIHECWANPYYAFSKPAGTSLICIQGHWSNVVDAKLKGGLAAAARAGHGETSYTPLYTRAAHSPKPWGLTALFSEHTGVHPPIEVDWSSSRQHATASIHVDDRPIEVSDDEHASMAPVVLQPSSTGEEVHEPPPQAARSFPTLWEFAIAVNRSDPDALALASNGATADIAVEGGDVRKLLTTLWFRTVVPRLSDAWRARILNAFVGSVMIPNHVLKRGRQNLCLADLTYPQLQEIARESWIPDVMRPDLDLVLTIGRLWGQEAVAQLRFTDVPQQRPSMLAGLLHGLR